MAISSPSSVNRRIIPSGTVSANPAKTRAMPREKRSAIPSTA